MNSIFWNKQYLRISKNTKNIQIQNLNFGYPKSLKIQNLNFGYQKETSKFRIWILDTTKRPQNSESEFWIPKRDLKIQNLNFGYQKQTSKFRIWIYVFWKSIIWSNSIFLGWKPYWVVCEFYIQGHQLYRQIWKTTSEPVIRLWCKHFSFYIYD